MFAAVHPVRHTPHVAVITYVILALGLGLTGTFEQLAIFTNVAGLLVYIAVASSLSFGSSIFGFFLPTAHLTTSARFRGRAQGPVSGQLSTAIS